MNEEAARKVVLVRTIENADGAHQVLSDDDRLYASRSAHELAQWEASDRRTTLTPALPFCSSMVMTGSTLLMASICPERNALNAPAAVPLPQIACHAPNRRHALKMSCTESLRRQAHQQRRPSVGRRREGGEHSPRTPPRGVGVR